MIGQGKAGKPNELGRMVKPQEAADQIVIDFEVYQQRPNDADRLIPSIETHQQKLGSTPRLLAVHA